MYQELRYRHHWITGQTQSGKTERLKNAILDDIYANDGVLVVDPKGELTKTILASIPKERAGDVIVFDPSDTAYPIGWNPLETVPEEKVAYTAETFKDTVVAAWGYADIQTPQMDQILYNAAVSMLYYPDGTILSMYYFLTRQEHREKVLKHTRDPVVVSFWEDFNDLPQKEQRELTRSTLNKIQMLIADPKVRNIIGQTASAFRLKDIIETGKILIVKLPISVLGTEKTATIGSLLISQLYSTAMQKKTSCPFHVHIDGIQHFPTPSFINLLSDIGERSVSLTFTSQYLDQLTPAIRSAVIANTGTKTIFRLGMKDAKMLGDELPHNNNAYVLSDLPPYTARLITPSKNTTNELSQPYYELTEWPHVDKPSKLVKLSRRTYATQRVHLEPKLRKFIGGMT